jgi:UDP-N-acetylglucosamine 2-epimerase (non-hydrolysing)
VHNIIVVFGTRPEAIKLAPVVLELRKHPGRFRTVVVVTAQHREMLDQVLRLFQFKPDRDLDIMRPAQTPFDVTERALRGLKPVFEAEQPDLVLVQGDTTTTFAAALAAFYLKIPVGHVEAGLRTGDKYQPFPEEINRRLTTVLTDLYFAPTEWARQNLLRESIPAGRIFVTGNTVIDALLMTAQRQVDFDHPVLNRLDFDHSRVILVTAHRRENWGEPMRNICCALKQLVVAHRDVDIVFVVHLNPAVQQVVREELNGVERIHLLEPLSYEPFVHLMARSHFILTDSGGIQEEAPSLGKPVLVLRNVTERPEGIEAGTLKLVGTNTDRIVAEAERLLTDGAAYRTMARAKNPYGDGHAAERIVEIIEQWLG